MLSSICPFKPLHSQSAERVVAMPPLSDYMKQKAVDLFKEGKSVGRIVKTFHREALYPDRSTISKFIKKYKCTGQLTRISEARKPRKMTTEISDYIEETMNGNDETTLLQLRDDIEERFQITLSKSLIHRERTKLGWSFKRPAYCQVVREANRIKRLEFAQSHQDLAVSSRGMIFTDETSCELQCHRLRCARKKGQPPKPKPRTKHPVKVSLISLFIFTDFLIAPYHKAKIQ